MLRSKRQERAGLPVLALGGVQRGWTISLVAVPQPRPSPAPMPELFWLCSLMFASRLSSVCCPSQMQLVFDYSYVLFFCNFCLTVVTTQMLWMFSRLAY